MRISPAMMSVLRELKRSPRTAAGLRCSISTLCALERRKLIRVETTFSAVAYPRTAMAYITDEGRVAAFTLKP